MDFNLEFKDFYLSSNQTTGIPMPPTQPPISGNLLDANSGIQASSGSLNNFASTNAETGTKPHFLSLVYYQRFFDIDDDQVFARILNSAFPRKAGNFITDFIQPNPDFWGPFWISTTLVFSIAIVGNFARFLYHYGTDELYISDFSYVTGATSLVFGYVLLLPSLIYTFLWYYRSTALQYSFFDLICAYGYSLSLFVPASILCPLISFNSARWAFTITSALFSGSVLTIALWSTIKNDPNKLIAIGFVAAAFLAHVLLAFCLKEFFFDATGFPANVDNDDNHFSVVPTSISPTAYSTTNGSLSG